MCIACCEPSRNCDGDRAEECCGARCGKETIDMSMKIFLTGYPGWLAKNVLASVLQPGFPQQDLNEKLQGAEITCLALPSERAAVEAVSSGVNVVFGDLTKKEDCERFLWDAKDAVVIHIAGIIHPRRVREFYSINVEGTRNLLEAASAKGARRIVVMSSNSPIGVSRDRSV